MKGYLKSVLGVTLLEIMLVLAVAAIVIVMSVRYYQTATGSQQANSALEQIQAITAAADGLATQADGSYANVSTATVQPLMPNNSLATPWGGTITVTAGSATGYTVTVTGMPANVCGQIVSRLGANTKYSSVTPATCPVSGTTTLSYVYNSQL